MTLVLDAGALIGVDRTGRQVGALLRIAQRERIPVRTSAAAVAQVWRSGSRQANLARTLTGVGVDALDHDVGRRIGDLLGRSRTTDVIDAHVALVANAGDTILTSDVTHIRRLMAVRKIHTTVTQV
jgi:hypothetical protein